jgi:hypothetical protein
MNLLQTKLLLMVVAAIPATGSGSGLVTNATPLPGSGAGHLKRSHIAVAGSNGVLEGRSDIGVIAHVILVAPGCRTESVVAREWREADGLRALQLSPSSCLQQFALRVEVQLRDGQRFERRATAKNLFGPFLWRDSKPQPPEPTSPRGNGASVVLPLIVLAGTSLSSRWQHRRAAAQGR